MTFDFETLIAEAGLKAFENSFYFGLRTKNPENLSNVAYWGNKELFSQDSFILPIQLSDGQWELAIYPEGGWNQRGQNFAELVVSLILLTIIISIFSYEFVIRIRIRKRQAILDPLTKTASRSEFYRIFEELRRQWKRMRDSIRKDDVISRYGGDEFVLLIRHIENEQALHIVAERILATLGSPITIGETVLSIGASIGGIVFQEVDFDFDHLLGQVDQTMYDAKASGKNQFRIADTPISV